MITHLNSQLPNLLPLSNNVFNELNRLVHQTNAPEWVSSYLNESDSDIESIRNDQDGWKIRLELPGYNKDEIKLTVDQDYIHVVAETTDEARDFLGKDERRIKVSEDVDSDQISARLENGILYLEIARRSKPEPKIISVD
ncbi:MAG: Hsp20/alpha crystallin family protein [Akkermansiaceae bacterium]